MHLNISLSKTVNILLIITFIFALLYFGRPILIPLTFSLIISMLLYPVCNFLEKYNIPRIPAILFTFFLVGLVISGLFYLLSSQVITMFSEIKDFSQVMNDLLNKILLFINSRILPGDLRIQEIYQQERENLLQSSSNIISKTISSSTSFLAIIVFIIVYTFLFLLYRTAFKEFILTNIIKKNSAYGKELVFSIQKVAQNYFYGLFMVIILIGTLNGLGLWIIGIDYPFLFGYLAAILTVIPYIGTTLGGLIPTFYALINYDSLWIPIAVLAVFFTIQTIEGNILTPKIVGERVSLNPLFALIALLLGGILWGVAGLILFIPLMAIIKVVFDHIDSLKPYGLLLSSEFANNKESIFSQLVRRLKEKRKKKN